MTATATPSARLSAHEQDLWKRFEIGREQTAREELVVMYMPMARRLAKRYAGVVEPYDDLLQVASLGLLNAIDRFDPARGIPFAGFAKPTILGELKRYFRDKVWTIRVPRSIHDRMARIEAATEELTESLSRPPLPSEIAAMLAIDVGEVLEAQEAKQTRRPLGLDAPVHGDEGEEAPPEWVGAIDGGYELIEERMTLESAMPNLDDRQREILRLRFVDDLPQSTIAERIGCSQMHVSRLLRATLERMREDSLPRPLRRRTPVSR